MDPHCGQVCASIRAAHLDAHRSRVRHNLTEATRDMVKKSTDDVKTLAAFPAGGPHVSPVSGNRGRLD